MFGALEHAEVDARNSARSSGPRAEETALDRALDGPHPHRASGTLPPPPDRNSPAGLARKLCSRILLPRTPTRGTRLAHRILQARRLRAVTCRPRESSRRTRHSRVPSHWHPKYKLFQYVTIEQRVGGESFFLAVRPPAAFPRSGAARKNPEQLEAQFRRNVMPALTFRHLRPREEETVGLLRWRDPNGTIPASCGRMRPFWKPATSSFSPKRCEVLGRISRAIPALIWEGRQKTR